MTEHYTGWEQREMLRRRHQDAMSSAMTAAALDAAVDAAVADGFAYDDFTHDSQLDELEAAIDRARKANNPDAYSRNPVEVILGAAEGPDGDPFGSFPKDGQP